MRALDLEGGAGFQEITQEKYMSDYREKAGLKMPYLNFVFLPLIKI